MAKIKKILFLEPFYGGSHKDFADGLVAQSRHEIELVTLPARFWKWRMRGAALYFIKEIKSFSKYDGLIITDLMSLSDLKALGGKDFPPSMVYFHENQLTYPTASDESIDYQFGFTNITTALAADRIIFNSHTHYESFFTALPGFISMMPEYHPKWVEKEIKDKSAVIYPGCRFIEKSENIKRNRKKAPLFIWNHRWEFDKNPRDFFYALDRLLEKGVDFNVALLGENFQSMPKEFVSAKEKYGDRIVVYGYIESKKEYAEWLAKGDVVISTAIQENFGISVIEAVRAGCIPFVPDRLSYPEIIPDNYHEYFLYSDPDSLVDMLVNYFSGGRADIQKKIDELSVHMDKFSWKKTIMHYDELLEEICSRTRNL